MVPNALRSQKVPASGAKFSLHIYARQSFVAEKINRLPPISSLETHYVEDSGEYTSENANCEVEGPPSRRVSSLNKCQLQT
ncbi:unnamed protein product [Schistocephalus solidus]|uniref:Uncharacterized protein n=1 Tax=Schistocephalus solidus TaxID=70667 RepID=A0A183TMY0_SCHSO|nr:unnamed protein product [Schistocephalus solidus]